MCELYLDVAGRIHITEGRTHEEQAKLNARRRFYPAINNRRRKESIKESDRIFPEAIQEYIAKRYN